MSKRMVVKYTHVQTFEKDAWFLLHKSQSQPDETPPFEPVSEGAEEEKLTNHELK